MVLAGVARRKEAAPTPVCQVTHDLSYRSLDEREENDGSRFSRR